MSRVLLDLERNEVGCQSTLHINGTSQAMNNLHEIYITHYLNFVKFGFHGNRVLTDRQLKPQTLHVKATKLLCLAFLYQFHIVQISEVHLKGVDSIKVATTKYKQLQQHTLSSVLGTAVKSCFGSFFASSYNFSNSTFSSRDTPL